MFVITSVFPVFLPDHLACVGRLILGCRQVHARDSAASKCPPPRRTARHQSRARGTARCVNAPPTPTPPLRAQLPVAALADPSPRRHRCGPKSGRCTRAETTHGQRWGGCRSSSVSFQTTLRPCTTRLNTSTTLVRTRTAPHRVAPPPHPHSLGGWQAL